MSILPGATTDSEAHPGTLTRLLSELRRIRHLAAPPAVTARLLQVMTDPSSSVAQMLEIIRSDPGMAAKILQIVNSAFYGMPARVTSLERAILLLGVSAVKNVALAASLARVFRVEAISRQFVARDLWRHCIAVAACARLLAKNDPALNAEETFVAALVHDLGLIAALQLVPKELRATAELCHGKPCDFCAGERLNYGADHASLGAALAAQWQFPELLRSAIAFHHQPSSAPAKYLQVVAATHLADTLCCGEQIGFWLTARAQTPAGEATEILGIGPDTLEQIRSELHAAVRQTEQLFSD